MACGDCGDNNLNPNIAQAGCGRNPCTADAVNTPTCETLPSQIENFSKQFFGVVTKTEVNGAIQWSLPCSLDVGLDNNPRGDGEGLACYFLRLFADGILGATGPQGEPGLSGVNGNNAYTVTTLGFTQPTLASPNVSVKTAYNPAIVAGIYVFIATSGWYIVNTVDASTGVLFLTFTRAVSGASGIITAGKIVVPSGFPGQSIVGPAGAQGLQGNTGPSGNTFTTINGSYGATVGTDYELATTYTAVTFNNSSPQILLPQAGRYSVTAVIGLVGFTGVLSSDKASFKLRNTSLNADVSFSEQQVSNYIDGQAGQLVLNALIDSDASNQTIALYGKCTTQGAIYTRALFTSITFFRIN